MAGRSTRVRVRTAKGRPVSSTRWLERHINDPYVQSARAEGYRSRAAYKLLELDQKFGLLRPGRRVLDLGCAPGGWLQVAAAKGARVVGVDLVEVAPLAGAKLLQGDIFDPAVAARLRDAAGGSVELVLSDLAAAATGQRAVDRLRAAGLAEAVLDLLPEVLAAGGAAVIKLVRGAEAAVVAAARRCFASVRMSRPQASRAGSSEIYLIATGFRPPDAG
jgi:23S rRNA (uridine2552-2'-O)-methyltransferase